MYYIAIENNKVICCSECKCEGEGVISIEVTEEQYNLCSEYGLDYFIYSDGEIIVNPNYEEEQLIKLKAEKHKENDEKASIARFSKEFTITIQEQECVFDTTSTTQTDLLTAFAVCSTGTTYDGWVTNNGIILNLTLEDVALISQTFKAISNVYGKWNTYKQAIDNAQTIEEVEAIEIDYTEGEDT